MPLTTEEANNEVKTLASLKFDVQVFLYKKMRELLWSYDELCRFSHDLTKDLQKYFKTKGHEKCDWYEDHDGCGYNLYNKVFPAYFKQSLEEISESRELPFTGKYYKLRKDALQIIFKQPPLELYDKSPERFKRYFEVINDEERTQIIDSIYMVEDSRHNKELDDWLCEKYPDMVKKIGIDTVTEDKKEQ